MKLTKIKVLFKGEDILSILKDFVKVDGLTFDTVEIKDTIIIKGRYKKGITIPFKAVIGIGQVHDNIVNIKILSASVAKIKILRGILRFALNKTLGNLKETGIAIDGDTIILDLKDLTREMPQIEFTVEKIEINKDVLEACINKLNYEEKKLEENKKENVIIKKVKDKYSKFRKNLKKTIPEKYKIIAEYALVIPDILALLIRLFKDDRVSLKTKAIAGGVIAYLISPFDIIPEFIPFIGSIDDVAVAFFGLNQIINEVEEEVILQNWEGKEDIILVIKEGVDYISNVVGAGNVSKLLAAARPKNRAEN